VIGVLLQSLMVVQKTASHYQREMADLIISPKISHIRWDEMGRAEELMTAGYEAGLKMIPDIRALIEVFATKRHKRHTTETSSLMTLKTG
jgi:hypothetical protein